MNSLAFHYFNKIFLPENKAKTFLGLKSYVSFMVLLCIITSVSLAHSEPAKVVLLLHGLASNLTTWNKLVDNQSGFDGHCNNTNDTNYSKAVLIPNSEGVYCMRFSFGSLDRISTAPKGLDNATCSQVGGCSGDYSTFETLGREIAIAISRIRSRLGKNVQIVLLGHSRGGLAARAFLQGNSLYRANVFGLITTGTPHAGSPLGRFYAHMNKNCLPESDYKSPFDFSDCAKDWRFIKVVLGEIGGLNFKAPSINYLSDASPSIKTLNTNILKLPPIKFTQIAYDIVQFGCLGGSLADNECGFDIFSSPGKPSNPALTAVLNGRTRVALLGDGIVPNFSQQMSLLKGWNRAVKRYDRFQRVHTSEPKQILDLSIALTDIYNRLGWIIRTTLKQTKI